MRPADAYQGVDESLQADVMRFMAIIAFCLIAILALVRSVEPAAPVPAPGPPPVGEPAETEVPPPAEARWAPITAPTLPPPAEPAAVPEPEPLLQPLAEPEPLTEPELMAEPEPLAQPEPLVEPEPPAEPAPAPDRPVEQGLSLRFASDSDFLRLVTSGGIRVYAFREGQVLAVGRDFGFQPVQAPGTLHELLPDTVPDLLTAALHSAHDGSRRSGSGEGAAAFQWGMAMPERMARQIQRFVDQGATGTLVIDRHGEVRPRDF